MRISVQPEFVNGTLSLAFSVIVSLGVVSEIALNVYGIRSGMGLVPLFNLSYEANVPTLYSSLLLLGCACLLFAIARLAMRERDAMRWHWLGLGLIFVYISIDEAVMIHENFNSPTRRFLNLGGIFYFAWVVPVAAFLVCFVLAYSNFLVRLPGRFRLLFVLSGAVYVGGAMGTELLVSHWYEGHGGSNLTYGLINLAQETLEILGASLFCSALIAYIGANHGNLHIDFQGDRLTVSDAALE